MRRGILISICILILVVAWIAFCGYEWSWGPFVKLHHLKTARLPGNAAQYSVKKIEQLESSPLAGKHILFLGSSVTYGASSEGVSFVEYIAARNGAVMTKEAVSGTTLVDNGTDSYIARMKRIDRDMDVDIFVCQLSTNDATQKKPLGEISKDGRYDTSTVAGAIEFIISFARDTWNCPVIFYTNPRYSSEAYGDMVELLNRIAEKWEISVIDMWNDPDFNSITDEQRSLYLADPIHPTQAGYLEWWTPYMETALYEEIGR